VAQILEVYDLAKWTPKQKKLLAHAHFSFVLQQKQDRTCIGLLTAYEH
jgi:hypothetical protein